MRILEVPKDTDSSGFLISKNLVDTIGGRKTTNFKHCIKFWQNVSKGYSKQDYFYHNYKNITSQ